MLWVLVLSCLCAMGWSNQFADAVSPGTNFGGYSLQVPKPTTDQVASNPLGTYSIPSNKNSQVQKSTTEFLKSDNEIPDNVFRGYNLQTIKSTTDDTRTDSVGPSNIPLNDESPTQESTTKHSVPDDTFLNGLHVQESTTQFLNGGFIAPDPPPKNFISQGPCGHGFELYYGDDYHGALCIKIFDYIQVTWSQALSICQQNSGVLVEIHHVSLNNFITRRLTPGRRYWMGVVKSQGEFKYASTMTSLGQFHPWRMGEPNDYRHIEDCAEIIGDRFGSWNDKQCSQRRYFICQQPVVLALDLGEHLNLGKIDKDEWESSNLKTIE